MKYIKFKIFLFIFIFPFIIQAEKVNINDAERTARNFYFEKTGVYQNEIQFENIFSYKNNDEVVYFIFDVLDNGGFVIVSAENAYNPIIAFSSKSPFKMDKMSDNVKSLYADYGDRITYIRENKMKASVQANTEWKKYNVPFELFVAVKETKGILLTTANWDQGGGFDDFIPFDEDGTPPVGCVATAMGIIMKYWEYPMHGTGSTSYYESPYGLLSANFGESSYFWNLMDDNNSGNTFEAHISYHCAVAVHMDFGLDGSGAYVSYGANSALLALENYFNYSTSANFKYRSDYTDAVWKTFLSTEIDAGRPMIYRGSGPDGGHAWICDGYNDSDLYHYNFGWGGYNNGYYNITNVNGFTDDNGAIMNIEPESYTSPQNAPLNFSAVLNTANVDDFTVDLTWDAPVNKDISSYKIFRIDYDSEGFDHTFNEIATISAGSTSYTDTDAIPGNKEYLVQAIYSDGYGEAINDYVKGAFYITFRVHDADGTIISNNGLNAQVIFNNETIICGFGSASFQGIPFGGAQLWESTADGHPTTYGYVDVFKYETIDINLDGTPNDINNFNSTGIFVYPNPVTDFVLISTPNIDDSFKLNIFDVSGKIIKSYTIDSKKININLSDLPKGFYLFEFNSKMETFVKKIIKE